ncbi:MAG: 3-deoxy-manno-octulosonate cytidylyltransferase [Cardiobacteriaceae bacterium]|nr:3-deoxy-manno-octulosonate cytidylyltransferase [Cardiobacteriaceae bacterium]
MADIRLVIPARYAATRLPAKPLADIAGVPLIVRTAVQARKSGIEPLVAYDDDRIAAVLNNYNIAGIKTSATHENGTRRLAEVVEIRNWADDEVIVNVQGDEPLLPPELISQVAENLLAHEKASVATLCTAFVEDEPNNPNSVKVVSDRDSYALYFSRSKIPYPRDGGDFPFRRHIGIYAYRAGVLREYTKMQPTPLEQAEKLEQLRFLEYGKKISLAEVAKAPPAGVDCEEDRLRVAKIFELA